MIGLFCHMIGLFCHIIHLFCRMMGKQATTPRNKCMSTIPVVSPVFSEYMPSPPPSISKRSTKISSSCFHRSSLPGPARCRSVSSCACCSAARLCAVRLRRCLWARVRAARTWPIPSSRQLGRNQPVTVAGCAQRSTCALKRPGSPADIPQRRASVRTHARPHTAAATDARARGTKAGRRHD